MLFVDSDDRLCGENAVDKLLIAAFKNDADIVDGDYVSVSADGTIHYEVKKYPEGDSAGYFFGPCVWKSL